MSLTESILTDIIQLIHKLYEMNCYWRIQGDEMEKFLNAENGVILHNESTIIIKDLEFECTVCPNGWKAWAKHGHKDLFIFMLK